MQIFELNPLSSLQLIHLKAERVLYQGRHATRLLEADRPEGEPALALIAGSDFADGVIETQIAGAPRADAPGEMRGFVGLAFRAQPDPLRYECFYIRPTNGRADDQLRRNHATQYVSHPDFPWHKLREETPGLYESYTDLVPGAWTRIKIVVRGLRAELTIGDASQPCLLVNDLKLGTARGQIGLWVGPGTEAHFSPITIKER